MSSESNHELSILNEKLRALQTLMRCERDLAKLKYYKYDLDLVGAQLHEAEISLYAKKGAKVLPFTPKKPARSA